MAKYKYAKYVAQLLKQKKQNKKTLLKTWSKDVRKKFDNKCAICGHIGGTLNKNGNPVHNQAHHIIKGSDNRLDILNGVCLCPTHHRFSQILSAHGNALPFLVWLQLHLPDQFNYVLHKFIKQNPNLANLLSPKIVYQKT